MIKVSIDTRTLQPGDVFIAIQGVRFDGHNFIEEAMAKGAVRAVVERDLNISVPLPLQKVPNTRVFLGDLAKTHRDQFHIPVVAVTGSCGKTTTKSMIGAILALQGETLISEGTKNNDIGLPFTLFRLTPQHQYAVVELGANHQGEIATLTRIARPTIAVITCAAPMHLEGFGGIEGVAKGKGEIIEGVPEEGCIILNADDPFFTAWKTKAGVRKVISFGITHPADVRASQIELDAQHCARFMLHTPAGKTEVRLALMGSHHVKNALAAACVAIQMQVPLKVIKAGLENVVPIDKRLVCYPGVQGAKIFDDTYNAGPLSFQAALEILQREPGEKILVISDMGELGDRAVHYHQQLGEQARERGVKRLLAVGNHSRHTVESFGEGAQHFSSQEMLLEALQPLLNENTVVLVKGSRSGRMEKIVCQLIKNPKG